MNILCWGRGTSPEESCFCDPQWATYVARYFANENRVLSTVCHFTRPNFVETLVVKCSCTRASQRGQGMLEYALIVFFIVILDPYLATVPHIQITLDRLIYGFKLSEFSLIIGLIRTIEDVLADCSQVPLAPGETRHWSPATQRLIQQGLLIDADGLTLVGDIGPPSLEQLREVRADLEMWRELTALILAEQNLERAICEEIEAGDA